MGRWIFGYGSLVWRPAFAHGERRPAFVDGFVRRFWQGSTDHRGVPGAPGRVVTLLPDPAGRVFGAAYRVPPEEEAEVMANLDHREKGGYERCEVTLHLHRGDRHEVERVEGLVYRATPENPNYLGPASLEAIALQVLRSSGPSGANLEYVLRLAESLRELGAEDDHVFALEALLREAG